MTPPLPKYLKEKREALATTVAPGDPLFRDAINDGFDACYALMSEELTAYKEALEGMVGHRENWIDERGLRRTNETTESIIASSVLAKYESRRG